MTRRGGFRTRYRVQLARAWARAARRIASRDHWGAVAYAQWGEVLEEDEQRMCPHPPHMLDRQPTFVWCTSCGATIHG